MERRDGRFAHAGKDRHEGLEAVSGDVHLEHHPFSRLDRRAQLHLLPDRLAADLVAGQGFSGPLAAQSNAALDALGQRVNRWQVKPVGTEGYRTAEVTLGGVDTRDLDAKTMQARAVPGLYFIGEVVDVTGWLGGYNFQWAWSSGWAAGQAV